METLNLSALEAPHSKRVAALMLNEHRPKGTICIKIGNEIRPIDIYCYLYAKYGSPNGLQNLLRKDSSDNLIHWDWTLVGQNCLLQIMGLNYRTEVWLFGDISKTVLSKELLLEHIKSDIGNYGKDIGEIRKSLEKWKHFVNPFHRLQSSIKTLKKELDSIGIDLEDEGIKDISEINDLDAYTELWKEKSTKYSKALGIAFGIRAMLPVLAESFVNLVIFGSARAEIRTDKRLMDDLYKRPIDVRIKSFHINCGGFAKAIDYSSKECANYHTLVNERNDLLHGNIAVDKLCFEEIYFKGNVPIFKEYRSMWERSLRIEIDAVGLRHVQKEIETIDNFIAYIISCMTPAGKKNIEHVMARRDIGFNPANSRVGVLLPKSLPDFHMSFSNSKRSSDEA